MRPMPPDALVTDGCGFAPAPELLAWARGMFIIEGAVFENPDHAHLAEAAIGFLWTNAPNTRKGRRLLGTCAQMPPSGDKWSAARTLAQIRDWFPGPEDLDFLITIYAPEAAVMDDASFMALIEHELYHAAQARDREDQPAFDPISGKAKYTLRGHDVEEFVGVVARYGADATRTRELVDAANAGPTIAAASIASACGNCMKLVA